MKGERARRGRRKMKAGSAVAPWHPFSPPGCSFRWQAAAADRAAPGAHARCLAHPSGSQPPFNPHCLKAVPTPCWPATTASRIAPCGQSQPLLSHTYPQGCSHAVLVGDHCQLPPVVQSEAAARGGLGRSLFERLMEAGVPSTMLQVVESERWQSIGKIFLYHRVCRCSCIAFGWREQQRGTVEDMQPFYGVPPALMPRPLPALLVTSCPKVQCRVNSLPSCFPPARLAHVPSRPTSLPAPRAHPPVQYHMHPLLPSFPSRTRPIHVPLPTFLACHPAHALAVQSPWLSSHALSSPLPHPAPPPPAHHRSNTACTRCCRPSPPAPSTAAACWTAWRRSSARHRRGCGWRRRGCPCWWWTWRRGGRRLPRLGTHVTEYGEREGRRDQGRCW